VAGQGAGPNGFLQFNYDVFGNPSATERIIPRAVTLIDYTPGGPDYAGTAGPLVPGDVGGTLVNGVLKGSEIHGEAGNDFIYGGPGNGVIFGDGQNDSIVGGYGADWISGGTGDDGILGDDGRIFSSGNSTSYGEPLYGIAPIPAAAINQLISDSNDSLVATINVDGALKYTAELTPDNLDPNHASPNVLFRPKYANDIIYGGLGNDSIHGGAGDDAISGAEALPVSYTTNYDANGVQIGTVTESDFFHPFNPGNPLGYNPATTKFALYDANDPLRKILLTPAGALSKTGSGLDWILNFDATQGPVDTHWIAGQTTYAGVPTDGDDRIFGDLGNDWAVGGTGRDQIFGGWGDDLINLDDVLTTNGGLNDSGDTNPSYEDLAFGGAGRDVIMANTGGDRMVDWVGEFNSFIVPFSQFGLTAVGRMPQPAEITFLYQLSKSDGADQRVGVNHGGDPARNGEPFGELGLVVQSDAAWQAQSGAPRDPQPGNGKAKLDVRVSAGTLPIWQFADGPAPTDAAGAPLSSEQLAPVVAEAKQLWTQALGAGDPHLAALDGVSVQVGNLPTLALGATLGDTILLDSSAAGWGWSTSLDSPAPGRMDLLSTVLHEMGNAMGFAETDGHGVMGLVLDPGVRTLPGENTPLYSAAPHAEAQPLFGMLDATPMYVSADRSIDWSQPVLDVTKPKKGDVPATAQPAWVGDFVNHLARTNSERNPNLGIRVQVEAASKVSSTLLGG